jgi:hypothetical protein
MVGVWIFFGTCKGNERQPLNRVRLSSGVVYNGATFLGFHVTGLGNMVTKSLIRQVGITTEGKPVVAQVYREYETSGVPLEVLLSILNDRGMVVCWISLYREARLGGMKHSRILSMLDTAVSDSYGGLVRDEVLRVLRLLHDKQHPCLS